MIVPQPFLIVRHRANSTNENSNSRAIVDDKMNHHHQVLVK